MAPGVAADSALLPRVRLTDLFGALTRRGYRIIGPTVRDGAIVLDQISRVEELPIGWTDEQAPGHYRLRRRDDSAVFGYVVGADSFKRTFFAPEQRLFRAQRQDGRVRFVAEPPDTSKVALLGARGCDLAAIETQDTILRDGKHPDPHYVARRSQAFVVAVNCGTSSSSCFCTSFGTGPRATRGFDLALTELLGPPHRFVLEVRSDEARAIVDELGLGPASDDDQEAARAVSTATANGLTRQLDTTGIVELLLGNLEHPRWQHVGDRCLACSNCTAVCPTCFCSDVKDHTSLDGNETERVRTWDSCFSAEYSAVHGHPVRNQVSARYRQWLTHKLATWIQQFGSSGCVGCGRCISWCPAAIDLTEEVSALREAPEAPSDTKGTAS